MWLIKRQHRYRWCIIHVISNSYFLRIWSYLHQCCIPCTYVFVAERLVFVSSLLPDRNSLLREQRIIATLLRVFFDSAAVLGTTSFVGIWKRSCLISCTCVPLRIVSALNALLTKSRHVKALSGVFARPLYAESSYAAPTFNGLWESHKYMYFYLFFLAPVQLQKIAKFAKRPQTSWENYSVSV